MRVTKKSRWLWLLLGAAALAGSVSRARPVVAAEPAAAAATPRRSTPAERQARGEEAARAFMMGRYEDALATYLDLYIQSDGRPEYLRNIGRCQQKLRQYARATDSFREYLRRNRRLSAEEKNEVEGFISEMETALQREKTASAAPTIPPAATATAPAPAATPTVPAPPVPPTTAPAPPAAPVSLARAPDPSASSPKAPANVITGAPGPGPASGRASPVKAIGIAAVAVAGAAAIGGTIALFRSRSIFDDATRAGCHDGVGPLSYCNGKADSVKTSNSVSQLLYIGAAALGVAGGIMIAVAPSPDGRVSLLASGRF